jgi:hypothetical protein
MTEPEAIVPARYTELARLVWNRDPNRAITGQEALNLYEANWRHVDIASLLPAELALIDSLAARFGGGHLLGTK